MIIRDSYARDLFKPEKFQNSADHDGELNFCANHILVEKLRVRCIT